MQFNWKCHDFQYIDENNAESWDEIGNDVKWSVVVVHAAPEKKRDEDLIRMADQAEVLIAPDYTGDTSHFNYVHKWKLVKPYVTIMSNEREDVVEGIAQLLDWIEEAFCMDISNGECIW